MSKRESIEILARGLVTRQGLVLLCQNREHGYCYLPGGHVEFGEPAARAVERELLEEAGAQVRAGGLLLVEELHFEQRGKPRHELTLVFHVEHALDQVVSREPDIGFLWASEGDLGRLDVRPASMMPWLMRALRGHGLPSFTWHAMGK